MPNPHLHSTHSRSRISPRFRSGDWTPTAVAAECLRRIEAYADPAVFISLLPRDEVMAQARHAEQRLAAGERHPLLGIPFAIKDNIDMAGHDTTAACPDFAYRPGAIGDGCAAAVARRARSPSERPISISSRPDLSARVRPMERRETRSTRITFQADPVPARPSRCRRDWSALRWGLIRPARAACRRRSTMSSGSNPPAAGSARAASFPPADRSIASRFSP